MKKYKGTNTNRFSHVKYPIGGRGGVERTLRFQNFCSIEIYSEIFLQGNLFYSFHLLLILLVRKNFDSSCPFSLSLVIEITSLTTS